MGLIPGYLGKPKKSPLYLKTLLLFTTLINIFYLPVQSETVYCKIANDGKKPIILKRTSLYPNLNKITDNKKFWNSDTRIEIGYENPDNKFVENSTYSAYCESHQMRKINPNGFVIYKVEREKQITDFQIQIEFNTRSAHEHCRIEIFKNEPLAQKEREKQYFERKHKNSPGKNLTEPLKIDPKYIYPSNGNLKLDAFIDFESKKIAYNGDKWKGTSFSDRFGMAECYWYGFVKPFYNNAEIKYWKYNSTDFFIDGKLKDPGKAGYFGADLEWKTELEQGYEYSFTTVLDTPPDAILINNKKLVWEKTAGFYAKKSGELIFYYTPDENETITISYIKNATPKYTRLDLNGGYWQELYSTRRPVNSNTEYEKKSIIKNYVPIDHITLQMLPEYLELAKDVEISPLPELPYQRADFNMVPRGSFSADKQIFDVIEKYGIKHAVFSPEVYESRYFEQGNFRKLHKAGVQTLDFMVFSEENGKIQQINPHWHADQFNEKNAVSATTGLMKKWLEVDKNNQVLFHFQEVNCLFGGWGKNIKSNDVVKHYGYDNIDNKSVQECFDLHINEILSFTNEVLHEFGSDAERVKKLYLPDRAGLNPAYWVKAGADIIVMKNIHRQSVNIVTSSARGMANSYDIEYGYDVDLWDRCTKLGYHPDEFKQICRVYIHAGGKYLIEEGLSPSVEGKFTKKGKAWLEMAKYAKSHPPLGKQVVQIAVMRGYGDEWHTIGSPSSSWESGYYEKTVNGENYLRDYNLLDHLFAEFGTYWNTKPDRLCTGTPYGPVDFIPWEAPINKLNKYKLIVIMGFNTLEKEHIANLAQYVKQGGTLICAAGQVKSRTGDFYIKAKMPSGSGANDTLPGIESLFGITPGTIKKVATEQQSLIPDKKTLEYKTIKKDRPYYPMGLSGKNTEVLEKMPNQAPLLVKNQLGKGKAYIFAGEHLTEFGEDIPGKILKNELGEIQPVTFQPFSNRIEYMVRRKGASIILPLFNHGNAGFPSGKTRLGKWSGKITLNKDAYNITSQHIKVYRVLYDEQNSRMNLEKIQSENKDGKIIFNAEINMFTEYIIGPAQNVQQDYLE